jgi:hypothetical protein
VYFSPWDWVAESRAHAKVEAMGYMGLGKWFTDIDTDVSLLYGM